MPFCRSCHDCLSHVSNFSIPVRFDNLAVLPYVGKNNPLACLATADGVFAISKYGRIILIPRVYLQDFIEKNTIMCCNDSQMKAHLSCCGKGA